MRQLKEAFMTRYGVLLLLALFLVGGLEYLGFLRGMDHHFHDLSLRIRGERPTAKDIVIVAIDEKTLLQLGRWPIPRHYYAGLLDQAGQARVLGMDIVFSEPSEEDADLSRALQAHGRVVLPAYADNGLRIHDPLPDFSAAKTGHVHLEQDIDGIVRKVFHRIECDGRSLPSFSSAIYDLAKGRTVAPPLGLEGSPRRLTLIQREPMRINYYGADGSYPRVSLSDVVDGKWPSSFFRGKIVLVGVTGAGIEEKVLTPLGQDRNRMPGVEVHAHIVNNLLDGSSIRLLDPRARWPLIVAFSLFGFSLFIRFVTVRGTLIWLLGLFVTLLCAFVFLARFNLWVPPAAFLFCFTTAYLLAYVYNLERMKGLLQRAKEDWEESFNTIQDAIVTQDRGCHIVKTNTAAREVFGRPLFGLLSSRCLDFQRKGPGNPGQATEELFDSDLSRHLEIKSMPRLDHNGQFEGMVQIVRDITERVESERAQKILQSQLVQAQKMEAIGTLAGGIAHDFNNILAAIIGFTELALFALPNEAQTKSKLDEVLKGAERARKLIQRILAFSRQSEREMASVPVAPIIKEALKLLRSTLPSTIEIQPDIQSEGKILGDPTQIHQIVMNLCTNAYHAMRDDGGILRVVLRDVTVGSGAETGALPPGRYIRMTVSDTGQGMTPEIKNRIFEPYFTTKEKGVGTGLGLSVVHGIVKNHAGRITVRSEPGKGTTFEILLPEIEDAAEGFEEDRGAIPTGNERVLLVDDEPVLLDLEKEMLERLGYGVVVAASSTEALDTFRRDPHRFDLILTDMTMPKMTGERLAAEMIRVRQNIPIILCTGFSETMNEEKARSLGIREFVMKPLVLRDLAIRIRRALDTP